MICLLTIIGINSNKVKLKLVAASNLYSKNIIRSNKSIKKEKI